MKTISFPASGSTGSLSSRAATGSKRFRTRARRTTPRTRAKPDAGQIVEAGLMSLLALIGFASVGWCLFATW